MNLSTRRPVTVAGAVLVAGLGALGLAAPAQAASTTAHYSYSEGITTEVLPCGAVWTYESLHSGIATKTDGMGGFARIVQHDTYPGTITYQGRTYTTNDHQTNITTVRADGTQVGALNGQGLFTTLQQFGWRLVSEGVTSLDEVDRVAGMS